MDWLPLEVKIRKQMERILYLTSILLYRDGAIIITMSTDKSSFSLQAFSKFLYNEKFNWESKFFLIFIVKEFGESLETEARLSRVQAWLQNKSKAITIMLRE